MFPLGMVVFPYQVVALCVFEERYLHLLDDVVETQRFGTCLIERGSEVGGGDVRSSVGTMLQIRGQQRMTDGEVLVVVEGLSCFAIGRWLEDQPYPRAVAQERWAPAAAEAKVVEIYRRILAGRTGFDTTTADG